MSFNKKFFTTGGIVASTPSAPAAFDPLQNFETVTYTGNGSTQKITGYIRKGGAFNGSSSRISLPSSINTNYVTPTGSFTASTWVNFNTIGTAEQQIICFNTAANLELGLNTNSNTGKVVMRIYKSGASPENVFLVSSTTILANTWYHIAITHNNGSWALYIDGSSEDTGTQILTQPTTNIFLGERLNNSQYLNGKIDQVRIFDKALDSGEVGQLALEDYTDPKKSTTDYFGDGSGVALYELDEDANSSNFGQAAVFNGTNYITTPTLPDYRSGFAFSCWVLSDTTLNKYIITQKGTGDYLNFSFGLSNGKVRLRTGNGTSAFYIDYTAPTALTDGWHHLVVTGTASSITIYVDGAFLTTQTGTAFLNSSNMQHIMGVNYYLDSIFTEFAGAFSLDQVRIYSSALDLTDVQKLYKESADVPTANLIAHYKLDGNANDATETYNGTASNVTYSAGLYGGTPTNVNFLGMAFQPDLVWMKGRTFVSNHFSYDSVRGATKTLYPNLTDAEAIDTNALTSFDSNGFTIGSYIGVNANNEDYVAWCWKAGGAAVSNTDGSITSTVSANPDAGFSIVKYTGNGTTGATVGHGLSQEPDMIIVKNLDGTTAWEVYVNGITLLDTNFLQLNTSGALGTASFSRWDVSAMSSTVFGLTGTSNVTDNTNQSGFDHIAYCFHSVDGYQKVGSYTGNGGSSVNSITTGFEPRFLMFKRTDASVYNWVMYDNVRDTVNPINTYLNPNTSDAESVDSSVAVNFVSNGFEIPTTSGWAGVNASGGTYIYLAIA